MSDLFGHTRTVIKSRYALITPDGFVPSQLPGWKGATVVVNISPAMAGPRFTQLHVTLEKEAVGEGNTGANQYFIYVIEGTGSILLPDKRHRLEAGSYIYLPPGRDLQIKSSGPPMKLLIFQKPYEAMKGTAAPAMQTNPPQMRPKKAENASKPRTYRVPTPGEGRTLSRDTVVHVTERTWS